LDNYDFFENKTGQFIFDVTAFTQYAVKFSVADYLFKDDKIVIYDVAFDKTSDIDKIKNDEQLTREHQIKTRLTILAIIEFVIQKYECSIFFVCHSVDGKAEMRYRLFQLWNEQHNHNFKTLWQTYEIKGTTQSYHIGAIAYNEDHYAQLKTEMNDPDLLSIDKE